MVCEVYSESKFKILYQLPEDINLIICIGGRGGMKTYEISKFAAFSACIQKKRVVILRDEKATIKDTILNEIWARYETANENGALDKKFDKNEYELKDKINGKVLIYTKGFRASSNLKKTNLKGASDIDIAIVEEGEDIRDKDKFYTFIDSLRKEGSIVIIMLNTPDINHFIIKHYFNFDPIESINEPKLTKEECDGYFTISPKKIKGILTIQTNYKDNKYLPTHIIDRYESYGDRTSPKFDSHYYLTAIKGYASTGRKGQILRKIKRISLQEYKALPWNEIYGQDFGTSSPAGLVGVKFDRNNVYIRELNYNPMSILNIGKLYCQLKFTPIDKIIVDHADPEWIKLKGFSAKELSIEDLKLFPDLVRGFHVVPCQKGAGSIREGISILNGMNVFAVEESINLWNEIMNWVYARDKNGNYTDDPEDEFNHLLDPVRYIILDQRGKKTVFGM
jgi:phage terminase large subunit